jgi:hypothetical protein
MSKEEALHAWAAQKVRALISRLRVAIQLGQPFEYPVGWEDSVL